MISAMNIFISLGQDFDESLQLDNFFAVMFAYNGAKEIDAKLKQEIRELFEYKWKYDRNNSITTETDRYLFDQLPSEV